MRLLEVCVDSFESALAALTGGANRIELCSSLADGGLTPTPGLLIQVQNANTRKVPIFCLLRCRPGNFVYTPEEIEIMKEDAKILRKYGANGIVFGALLPNGDVDMKNCREIVKAAYPLALTFHRAFDFCRRPTIEVEVIIDLGFTRILTSGKQENAQLGVKLIKKLMEQVGSRIIIMPGAGITLENIKFIVENTDALEYHGSFKKVREGLALQGQEEGNNEGNGVKLSSGSEERPIYVTDQQLVGQMLQILQTEY